MFKKILKKIVGLILPRYVNVQLKNFYILSFEYGQFRTIKNWECIDKNGKPIPWYTYPAIEYLSFLDFSDKTVFEYGGGYSTLWWAERSKKLITVESDKQWYEKIKLKLQSKNNSVIIYKEDKESYVNSILEQDDLFDVVIIDGLWRGECAKLCLNKVNYQNGFMIILDNSDWYPGIYQYFINNDLIGVDFHGFSPINGYTLTTTIFLSRNFKINVKKLPVHSIYPIFHKGEDDLCE